MSDLETVKKTVTFKTSVEIRKIIRWEFAHREARRRYWEIVAADRCRFARRIADVERLLAPLLKERHERFVTNEEGVSSATNQHSPRI